MAKKIYIGVFIGGMLILAIYFVLGGFKSVQVEEVGQKEFRVVGKYFYGEYDDPTLGQYFFEARELITSATLDGQLCIVTYQPDSLIEEFVSQFIGVAVAADVPIPDGMEERSFGSSNAAQAQLDMHPLVMPNPEKLQQKLTEFATSKGWSAPQYFLEVYKPDNSIEIYALK